MNKKTLITSGILLLTFLMPPAKADEITQLIIEKKLEVDRKTGFILASELKAINSMPQRQATVYASQVKPVMGDPNSATKTFSIAAEPDSFKSVIQVKDSNGNEIKRISVGRKAVKIIAAGAAKHLFVLCGGYFGSVWEIDPQKDMVVRKFSTSWNPTDLAVDPSGKFLYVTSGKLQKFSIDSDIVVEIDLPADVRYLESVNIINSDLVFGGFNKENNQVNFIINENNNKLMPTDKNAEYSASSQKTVETGTMAMGAKDKTAIIYSKNNDYLYLFSLENGDIEGMIPLDAKADDVMIIQKQEKAFVLHREIGQISIIDLKPGTTTRYSVIARILDDRLKDQTNAMVFEGNKVFIKSDLAQEGYIDTDNILRYTYPIVEVPLVRDRYMVEVATKANKRFYVNNNHLFVENISDDGLSFNRKTRINNFGETIGGIELSPDEKVLYVSNTAQNTIMAVDVNNNNLVGRFEVGSEPADLAINNGNLYVLNAGEQTVSTVDLKSGKTMKVSRLKVENNNLNIIKLYDRDFDQIIKVTIAMDVNKELSMVKAEN
jgi:DNA-binding beta-propeller fold protein YncE